jgi:hypothetical protein
MEDVIAYERNKALHRDHIKRIRNMKPVIDSKPPRSMGPSMIHLKTRPKKQQLIDDRRHMIAMENKKMMENMTKIMMAPKMKFRYVDPPSLNENERKMKVDLVNLDNRLLHERLTKVKPVIDRKAFEESFQRHLTVKHHMRKKFISKSKGKGKDKGKGGSGSQVNVDSMFDSKSYGANQSGTIKDLGGDSLSMGSALGSPIKSMAEFRKHVISKKQAEARGVFEEGSLTGPGKSTGGPKFENINTAPAFEMTHNPK